MPIFPSCNISGLNIIEPSRSPEVPPRTNSSSVAIAILVPFFALIFAGFGFYLYKQRWVQFHQWNYWWKKIGKCASWWSFPSHLIAGSLIKRSTAAALCMKTTTVRLHSRIPCTTPIPNPSRARSSASIPISIRFAQWFEGLMLSERSLLCWYITCFSLFEATFKHSLGCGTHADLQENVYSSPFEWRIIYCLHLTLRVLILYLKENKNKTLCVLFQSEFHMEQIILSHSKSVHTYRDVLRGKVELYASQHDTVTTTSEDIWWDNLIRLLSDTVDKMVKLMFCMISLLKKKKPWCMENLFRNHERLKSIHASIIVHLLHDMMLKCCCDLYSDSFLCRMLICTGKETDSLSNGLICIDSVWWKGCVCERPFRRGTSSRHHSALKPSNLLQIQVAWGTRAFLWMMLTIPHGISTLKLLFYEEWLLNGFHAWLF